MHFEVTIKHVPEGINFSKFGYFIATIFGNIYDIINY